MFRTTGCGVTATCTMLVLHRGQIASLSIASEANIGSRLSFLALQPGIVAILHATQQVKRGSLRIHSRANGLIFKLINRYACGNGLKTAWQQVTPNRRSTGGGQTCPPPLALR